MSGKRPVTKVRTEALDTVAHRRQFLKGASALGIAGLAGCLGDDDDDPADDTDDADPADDGDDADDVDDDDDDDDDDDEVDYPTEDIAYIVTAAPGGGSDIYAREGIVPVWEDYLGVNVTVENQAGPTPQMVAEHIDAYDPDGTRVVPLNPPFEILQWLVDPIDYHIGDTAGIGQFAITPYAICANPDYEIEGYEDLVDRYEDGEFSNICGQEHGTPHHALAILMRESHGVPWQNYIPYSGSAEAYSAVMADEVPVGVGTETAAAEFVDAGDLDLVSVPHSESGSIYPDAETFEDAGYESLDFVAAQNRTLEAHVDTPDHMIEVLADTLEQTVNDERTQEWAEETGNDLHWYGGPDHVNELRAQTIEELEEHVDIDELRE